MNTNNKNPQRIDKSGSDNRSDTRKHQYKEHDDVLTNDANYDPDTQKYIGKEEPEFDDKLENEEKKQEKK